MSLPDPMLRGAIASILDREGETPSAAKEIRELIERQRFFDLQNAPGELGVTERTMFRWLREGKLKAVMIAGRRMVDVMSVSVSSGQVENVS